jgi:hypothetical protein
MSRITPSQVVESYLFTGIRPCRGFGFQPNEGCALMTLASQQMNLHLCDVPHSYDDLSKALGLTLNYAISFTWGFDGSAAKDFFSHFQNYDETGFDDGAACLAEVKKVFAL